VGILSRMQPIFPSAGQGRRPARGPWSHLNNVRRNFEFEGRCSRFQSAVGSQVITTQADVKRVSATVMEVVVQGDGSTGQSTFVFVDKLLDFEACP
jgi:hypothetical protein